MDNFDDLIYSIRYELDAMTENLQATDGMDGSEPQVVALLKWIKMSANTIENLVDDYTPNDTTTSDLRNEIILDYPKRTV